jgi:hypothetical protein
MKSSEALFGIVLLATCMVGMGLYYADIQAVYSPANATSGSAFFAFNDSLSEVNNTIVSLQNHTVDFSSKGFLDLSLYSDAALAFLDVGKIIIQIPNILFNIIWKIGALVGMPSWFTAAIMAIVTIFFVFKVVGMFTNREEA